jgi:hypothetical protein
MSGQFPRVARTPMGVFIRGKTKPSVPKGTIAKRRAILASRPRVDLSEGRGARSTAERFQSDIEKDAQARSGETKVRAGYDLEPESKTEKERWKEAKGRATAKRLDEADPEVARKRGELSRKRRKALAKRQLKAGVRTPVVTTAEREARGKRVERVKRGMRGAPITSEKTAGTRGRVSPPGSSNPLAGKAAYKSRFGARIAPFGGNYPNQPSTISRIPTVKPRPKPSWDMPSEQGRKLGLSGRLPSNLSRSWGTKIR